MTTSWQMWAIPAAVFVFSLIALLWLRRIATVRIQRWLLRFKLSPGNGILRTLRWPLVIWCVIVSVILGVAVSSESVIPSSWKIPVGKGLWTLFSLSIALALLNIVRELITLYGPRLQLSHRTTNVIRNILYIVILIFTILIVLEIWGVPTSPLILLIAIVILAVAIISRDAAPNLFAGFQLNTAHEIKDGDYIKLGTGEEGQVSKTDWRNTHIISPDGGIKIIPNRKLLQTTLINYGHQIKKAKESFHFSSRLLLTELTGLKASNIKELCDILKNAPEPVIYFHTHHFLEQHFYMTPEPANDFAIWVNDSLGEQVLGERLASVDTMAYSDLSALRDRIISIIEEYLIQKNWNRQASEGDEFHFMKSVSIIFPTPYLATDLREFIEALRKVSLGSLYFHMYESRLRLGRGQNDFSSWLVSSMDETELAADISRIDPYTYTLEGLRSTLIRSIEKHLK